jgi:uncharacterized BrkB/YihY/UPF0761 family membrane protein
MNNTVASPALIEILGMNAPTISVFSAVGAVLLVRIMLLSREPVSTIGWWIYNVALTVLLMCAALIFVLDRHMSPGSSLLLGIGLGSSGIVLIDLAKRYLEVIVGKTASDTPPKKGE